MNAPSAVGDQMDGDPALEEAREAWGTPVARAHGYGSITIGCQIRNKCEKWFFTGGIMIVSGRELLAASSKSCIKTSVCSPWGSAPTTSTSMSRAS